MHRLLWRHLTLAVLFATFCVAAPSKADEPDCELAPPSFHEKTRQDLENLLVLDGIRDLHQKKAQVKPPPSLPPIQHSIDHPAVQGVVDMLRRKALHASAQVYGRPEGVLPGEEFERGSILNHYQQRLLGDPDFLLVHYHSVMVGRPRDLYRVTILPIIRNTLTLAATKDFGITGASFSAGAGVTIEMPVAFYSPSRFRVGAAVGPEITVKPYERTRLGPTFTITADILQW